MTDVPVSVAVAFPNRLVCDADGWDVVRAGSLFVVDDSVPVSVPVAIIEVDDVGVWDPGPRDVEVCGSVLVVEGSVVVDKVGSVAVDVATVVGSSPDETED